MMEVCKSLIDLANVERAMQRIPAKDVKICFDEVSVLGPLASRRMLLTIISGMCKSEWSITEMWTHLPVDGTS
jgi:hypothetical protein